MKEVYMKKIFFLCGLTILLAMYFSMVTAKEEVKKCTPAELFTIKCTQCHDAQKALKIHQTKTEWVNSIRSMQTKKRANISDKDAEEIAKLLGDPNLAAFEKTCSKCHTLERIDKTHMTPETCKQICEKMLHKPECPQVTEKEKKAIEEHLLYRTRPTYPMSTEK